MFWPKILKNDAIIYSKYKNSLAFSFFDISVLLNLEENSNQK